LLNKLFNTNFEVLNQEQRIGQTTQGIWVSFTIDFPVCIFDCEGTDSQERGDDRNKFENCSTLFALALSDVLIINMWTTDVGRYAGSNYGILKIVFEMNLKLFQQESEKKILVVLRDFNESQQKLENIKQIIKKGVLQIWKDIKKPEKFVDSSPEQFFTIEFITLPHKLFSPEKFDQDVKLLQDRFMEKHQNYMFHHSSSSKNVPADGFSKFCSDIWNTILNEKDLNIPSQKEMLAIYRCNEIKDEALLKYEEKLKKFSKRL